MEITRHFVDVAGRRVHFRRCGTGPALLMIHQSPRSSAELEALMLDWGRWFTCIAPDTPGFGQSAPLSDPTSNLDAFGQALVDLLDALGLDRVAGYGFHSGAVILEAAARRDPGRFSALALGGFPVWSDAERADFADHYLPPFVPTSYGEHLVWLWNRMLEQSWFFPWYAVSPDSRLSVAHARLDRVDAAVRDMLDSGDAYRVGYGAVLSACHASCPPAGPPLLITAYDGDPLQDHIDRLGALPPHWRAEKVASPTDHHARSLAFLRVHSEAAPAVTRLAEARDEGFVSVGGNMIHWIGSGGGDLWLHLPGDEAQPPDTGLAIDLPGHGLSSDGSDFAGIIATVRAYFDCRQVHRPTQPRGDADLLYPDLSPDRHGAHLTRAWSIVRARHMFDPWYDAGAATARVFAPADLHPSRLAREHRALMRARSARAWHHQLGFEGG